ncbi:transmembrane protein [Gigaspora margarita]|uniref:Dolichyl-diphosphooligosaccharide-protein glycosyltransferase subunit OST5 n=1 Tax=Gigaspora margarita TaxID=4874 RepID=A0A8H4AHP9_GIGMA|nr:transmembrane protein [Gigaspora margarita]
MSTLTDWQGSTPFTPLVQKNLFPLIAFLLLVFGFVASSAYSVIPTRKSLVDEIKSAIIASLLLGFGSIFLSMAVGVYV